MTGATRQSGILKNVYVLKRNYKYLDVEDIDIFKTTTVRYSTKNGIKSDGSDNSAVKLDTGEVIKMIELTRSYPNWEKSMNEYSDCIWEYLSPKTHKPVIHIFPTGRAISLVEGETLRSVACTQLSPETCADFIRTFDIVLKRCNIATNAMQPQSQRIFDIILKRCNIATNDMQLQSQRIFDIILKKCNIATNAMQLQSQRIFDIILKGCNIATIQRK